MSNNLSNVNSVANLENFGYREISIAADLMKAYAEGKAPEWFSDDSVTVEFNSHSGFVFLTNSSYEVLMLDDDGSLYGWHYLGYHGYEGSAADLWEMWERNEIESEDWEELAWVFEMEGMDTEAEEVRHFLDSDDMEGR